MIFIILAFDNVPDILLQHNSRS